MLNPNYPHRILSKCKQNGSRSYLHSVCITFQVPEVELPVKEAATIEPESLWKCQIPDIPGDQASQVGYDLCWVCMARIWFYFPLPYSD